MQFVSLIFSFLAKEGTSRTALEDIRAAPRSGRSGPVPRIEAGKGSQLVYALSLFVNNKRIVAMLGGTLRWS
jgi:hypothetical protein